MTFRNRLATAISILSVLALAQIARGETTREQPTTASETTQVEADLSLSGAEHGLAANGTIRIRQPLVQHMIEKALRGNERLADPRVEHVLADDVYVVSGNVRIVGPDLPVVIRIRLESEDGRLSLSFQDIEGFGPNEWYERSIIEGFAFALRSQGMPCDAVVGKRRITIGVNDFLHGAGMLPKLADFDERSTHLALARSAAGDLTFQFQSTHRGPRITPTTASDVAVQLDAEGVRALLGRVLASDYRVKSVELSENQIAVTGEARWRGMENASSGVELLAALLGDRSRLQHGMQSGQAWIPIGLTFRIDGDRLILGTSHVRATAALDRALTERGIAHRMAEGAVVLVWRDLASHGLGQVTQLSIGRRGLTVAGHLNADVAIRQN